MIKALHVAPEGNNPTGEQQHDRNRSSPWLTANFEAIGSRSTIDLDASLGGMEISKNG
jgi:hypothetical protein